MLSINVSLLNVILVGLSIRGIMLYEAKKHKIIFNIKWINIGHHVIRNMFNKITIIGIIKRRYIIVTVWTIPWFMVNFILLIFIVSSR